MRLSIAFVLVCAVVSGCGSNVWSCDVASTKECQDFPALVTPSKIDGTGSKCTSVSGGVWQHQACTHAQAIGGCAGRLEADDPESEATTWFYAGSAGVSSAADVMATCTMDKLTFVAP